METADTLLELLVQALRAEDLERRRVSFSALDPQLQQAVDEALNSGIPRDQAELVQASIGGYAVLVAFYRSDEHDFTAAYAFRDSQLVHAYEN